jgi:hypothetical protein
LKFAFTVYETSSPTPVSVSIPFTFNSPATRLSSPSRSPVSAAGMTTMARASGWRTRIFASVRAERPRVTSRRTRPIRRRNASSTRSSTGLGQSLRWTESWASAASEEVRFV